MARTPDDFDPDELDARWDDLTSRLGPLRPPRDDGTADSPSPDARVTPGPRDYEVTEDEDGFEQPDPPLGDAEPATVLAWLALGVGILAVFVGVAASTPGWVAPLGVILAVGGLVTLFVRLPEHVDRDDDGAQV
ncbi:MAG: hypothetical protein ACQERF_07850 [Actinomycetota bacterium]